MLDASPTAPCLPILLAGGQGSRLHELTEDQCKPSVPFAGAGRIVDFVMSAVLRAGFDRLLVATQYRPETLTRHLARLWSPGFARGIALRHGPDLIPGRGYVGTADAVAANLTEIDAAGPATVLVLAADHVHQIDLAALVAAHRASGASATVAATLVSLEDARAFGVFSLGPDGRATGFAEKPAQPAAMPGDPARALASTGIYVFDRGWLARTLRQDALTKGSAHDFGKDIMPRALAEGRLAVHVLPDSADGTPAYWRDVGTLDAYRLAQVDMIENRPVRLPDLPVASTLPVARAGTTADGTLHDSVALPGARIGRACRVTRAILGPRTDLPDGMVIGEDPTEDARWFRVTPGGTTLVTAKMLARRQSFRPRLYPTALPHPNALS